MTDTLKVSISEGELQGKKVSSKAGGVFYSFQGIPYAKPPVGPLRFKAPEPPEPWTGVRDARKEEAVTPHIVLSLFQPPTPPEPWTGVRDASKEEAVTPHIVLSLFQPPTPPEPWAGVRDASKEEAVAPHIVLSLFQPPTPPEPWTGVRDASKEEAVTPHIVLSLFQPPTPPEPWTGVRDASKEEAVAPHIVLSLFQPPTPPEPWAGVRDASKEEAVAPHIVLSLFQPPTPPEPWTGVRDASKEEAVAPHIVLSLFQPPTPPEPWAGWPVSLLKPVMVWIHGGAFEMGSGDSDFYGPDYFLAQDVVFVSINYRLGALGFLNLDGSDVSANNGLRDQVMALTWINKNISKFGGDPDNVTIFGESAGGASVHYLLLAPSAKGLFHKAIAQSGSALLPICHLSSSVSTQRAFRLGQTLGCETKDPQHLADFLRTVPAEKIVLSHGSAQSDEEKQRVLSIAFTPTEDLGADAFIPGDPVKLLKEGRFHKVPFITGVTSAEGKLALSDIFNCCDVVKIEKDFQRIVPWNLSLELGTQTCKDIAYNLRKFYFGNKPVNEETLQNYVDMQSDLHFNHGFYKSVKLQIEQSNSPIYAYEYDHKKSINFKDFSNAPENMPGAGHGEELFIIFNSSFFSSDSEPNTEDATVRTYIVKFWTNFAKTGNPNIPEEEVEWPAVTKEDLFYLKISPKLGVLKDFRKERMDFLDDLWSHMGKNPGILAPKEAPQHSYSVIRRPNPRSFQNG
uniref:Carboxylesterase type B domain-containing protein n=1 Tax=Timema shepardi TaxID=629360 RepID=A0A7R9G1S2_TIMSH|nr:unnamed protein product [Timema shepardi]